MPPSAAPEPTPRRLALVELDHTFFSSASDTNAFTQGLSLSVTELRARGLVPYAWAQRSELGFGLEIGVLHFEYDGWQHAFQALAPATVYHLALLAALEQRLAERWQLVATLAPGVYSDLESLSGDDLSLEGSVAVDYQIDARQSAGLGVAYLRSFGKALPLPVLRYHLRSSALTVDIALPRHAELAYELHAGVQLGAVAKLAGGQYHMDDERAEFSDLRESQLLLGPGVAYSPLPGLTLGAYGGVALLRTLKLRQADRTLQSYAQNPKPWLGVSASYTR